MEEIIDRFGRTFKTLRVSLTQVCNLGCVYCVDESDKLADVPALASIPPNRPALTTAQFADTIRVLHEVLDLETIRLTGGEPTLYRELVPLVEAIRQMGIPAIKMTTNGSLLAQKITDLWKAGLTSLNISLDAVDPVVYNKISRRKNLHKILDGIDKAIALGISVKINCVVMKGVNDTQILPLLQFAKERNIRIRFLEVMQMGHLYENFEQHFFSERQIIETISQAYSFIELPREESATAKYFLMKDGYRFGVISNESDPFCNDCNRLRLDSYGNVYGCLSNNTAINISDQLHNPQEVTRRLQEALTQKKLKFSGSKLSMLAIGG
ncbi:radical SAM protein [Rhodocytophaga aerolata]|uniref:Radical SAM protein n=1 Tax=Rhodocytophaga aerolata TaxID=455078 RepID=A0ABT8R5W8_9BACT|nr:radical SAM protein [Rhodocytophaga aerolata]MDO1447494.1 radical SAM protein [Rhodocytophaga aerolata]